MIIVAVRWLGVFSGMNFKTGCISEELRQVHVLVVLFKPLKFINMKNTFIILAVYLLSACVSNKEAAIKPDQSTVRIVPAPTEEENRQEAEFLRQAEHLNNRSVFSETAVAGKYSMMQKIEFLRSSEKLLAHLTTLSEVKNQKVLEVIKNDLKTIDEGKELIEQMYLTWFVSNRLMSARPREKGDEKIAKYILDRFVAHKFDRADHPSGILKSMEGVFPKAQIKRYAQFFLPLCREAQPKYCPGNTPQSVFVCELQEAGIIHLESVLDETAN